MVREGLIPYPGGALPFSFNERMMFTAAPIEIHIELKDNSYSEAPAIVSKWRVWGGGREMNLSIVHSLQKDRKLIQHNELTVQDSQL